MNYQSVKDGKTVDINIGDSDHRFSHVVNDVTYEYIIKSFRSDYKEKSVTVEYAEVVSDSQGNAIRTKALSYQEKNILRYQGLYNLSGFGEAAGDFYGKQCVNGVMERTIGFKAFDNTGAIIDHTPVPEP